MEDVSAFTLLSTLHKLRKVKGDLIIKTIRSNLKPSLTYIIDIIKNPDNVELKEEFYFHLDTLNSDDLKRLSNIASYYFPHIIYYFISRLIDGTYSLIDINNILTYDNLRLYFLTTLIKENVVSTKDILDSGADDIIDRLNRIILNQI